MRADVAVAENTNDVHGSPIFLQIESGRFKKMCRGRDYCVKKNGDRSNKCSGTHIFRFEMSVKASKIYVRDFGGFKLK